MNLRRDDVGSLEMAHQHNPIKTMFWETAHRNRSA
jgi:hypothetical protein